MGNPIISSTRLWASRILSGAVALFLSVDGGMKRFKLQVVVETTAQLSYPEPVLADLSVLRAT